MAAALMDRAGRRLLLLVSHAGMGLCLGVLSAAFLVPGAPYLLSDVGCCGEPVEAKGIYELEQALTCQRRHLHLGSRPAKLTGMFRFSM